MSTSPNQPLTQRQIVLNAIAARRNDPWPRGWGHVVLATPGSPRAQKAYHEPGGSFSPCPGSFGISVWIVAADGIRIATSDDIPLQKISQSFESRGEKVPALQTGTPYYDACWTQIEEGRWQGEVIPHATGQLALYLRSVGPAGAPIDQLDWDGCRLLVNHRWVITFSSPAVRVMLGDEETSPLPAPRATGTLTSSTGWAFARIEISTADAISVLIRDTAPQFATPLAYGPVHSTLTMEMPDGQFADSLNAQASHLLMGFIGEQTCPGEPTNYPLAWERDGAYAVVAMARCGQLDTARQLARYFAENDFFGGFGAEGDAPGSAINAIASVALILGDRQFTERVFPHIRRKVALIEEMLRATNTIRKSWLGPIVPGHLGKENIPVICQAASDGLIVGNMDLHFPVLYINAFSFRGLTLAARIAALLGHDDEASRWSETAGNIRQAFMRHFSDTQYRNDRTYMSSLWPTWIASPAYEPLRQGLADRWEQIHAQGTYPKRPLWTYFTVAEAHQWLFFDRPDRVWPTLRYFWANQCSPGLYSYWEGTGEENTFGQWEHLRGWLKPPHVTPHYWTAAEMLLLQLDMLCYVDESAETPTLVIGAGIPAEWSAKPMHVSGAQTILGPVDWSWDGQQLEVIWRGEATHAARPGISFANANVIIKHQPV